MRQCSTCMFSRGPTAKEEKRAQAYEEMAIAYEDKAEKASDEKLYAAPFTYTDQIERYRGHAAELRSLKCAFRPIPLNVERDHFCFQWESKTQFFDKPDPMGR